MRESASSDRCPPDSSVRLCFHTPPNATRTSRPGGGRGTERGGDERGAKGCMHMQCKSVNGMLVAEVTERYVGSTMWGPHC